MQDSISLICPHCDRWHNVTLSHIKGRIKAMKIEKSYESAYQMKHKSGPFYDRWVAAMEARGPQFRCEDCMSHLGSGRLVPKNYCVLKLKVVNPGCFACEHITYYQG